MIRIELYAETSHDTSNRKYSIYSIKSWCKCLSDVEENVLKSCDLYEFNLKDIKKIFIFIEGEENEEN